MNGSYKRWGFQLSLTRFLILCLMQNPGQLKWVREVFACILLVSAQPMHNMRQRLHETTTIKGRREKKWEKYSSPTNSVRCFSSSPSHESSGLVKSFFILSGASSNIARQCKTRPLYRPCGTMTKAHWARLRRMPKITRERKKRGHLWFQIASSAFRICLFRCQSIHEPTRPQR